MLPQDKPDTAYKPQKKIRMESILLSSSCQVFTFIHLLDFAPLAHWQIEVPFSPQE